MSEQIILRGVAQMVERYIRDVEAARSNRVTPIDIKASIDMYTDKMYVFVGVFLYTNVTVQSQPQKLIFFRYGVSAK